jgi:polysaccharide export outer membrane protein
MSAWRPADSVPDWRISVGKVMHCGVHAWCAVACAALLFVAGPAARAADAPGRAYQLHAGDKLMVGVFDDPKLPPQQITIAPDGRFSYPLIGELTASGKTVEQLRAEIESRLKKFVTEPSVTLVVMEVKGNVAYVIGQVNKPGPIEMNPAVNVLQALSIAGGLNVYAKADGIIVIRHAAGGQSVLNFHYTQVAGGRNLAQNLDLESGDVVVVP